MHIAIDIQNLLLKKTGIGHYLYNLLENLARLNTDDQFISFYFSSRGNLIRLPFTNNNFIERCIRFPPGKLLSFTWKHFNFPSLDKFLYDVDIYHFPNFIVRPFKKGKSVLTIYDLSYKRYPEFTEPKNLSFLEKQLPQSINCANKIITISRYSKNELAEFYPNSKGKTEVIYPGVKEFFSPEQDENRLTEFRKKHNLPDGYILFVGTIEPRKNLASLLEAYRILKKQKSVPSELKLVICGMKGWLSDNIFRQLTSDDIKNDVVITGYIPDEKMPLIYSAAKMLVFPSFYEGFGLPCLEAMASGVPVVCSNTSSLREAAGDAALMIDPNNIDQISDAIIKIVENEDLAQQLSKKGLLQASKFKWSITAQKTYDIYKSLL